MCAPLARHVAMDRLPIPIGCMLLLALAGCVGAPPLRSSSRHSGATATAQPTLTWHPIAPPDAIELASFVHQSGGATFDISPANGHDAWLCVPASVDSFAIWATTDSGTTWRQVGTLSPHVPLQPSCIPLADELDPHSLAARITWGAGADGTNRAATWLSSDGGATWHAVPGEIATGEIATHDGTTYALLEDTSPGPSARPGQDIAISTDGLRTWRTVHLSGTAPGDFIFRFWLSPTASELVVATEDDSLWHSSDGGATWTRLNAPNTQISLGAWIATQGYWLLCGFAQTQRIMCSTDLGASWTAHPEVINTYTCSSCGKWGGPSSGTDNCVTGAIEPDGALLFACPPNGSAPDPTNSQPANFALYRLAPGSSTWTTLGAAPGPWLTVPATGPLWCWNAMSGVLVTTAIPAL